MLEQIKAIIFDIDGTLMDSMWVWTSIDDQYLEKYHLTEPEGFHEGMEGKSYSETAHYFLDLFPQLPFSPQEIMEEWNRMAYEMYRSKVKLKPGAYEFIQDMKARGMKLGIATSNQRELAEVGLQANGIAPFFDVMWTSCEAKKGKPAPDVYLNVARDLGVLPEQCLVFEDVPMGILAGKNAGMKVCAVEDAFSAGQREKKKSLADYYIQTYYDIKNKTYEVL